MTNPKTNTVLSNLTKLTKEGNTMKDLNKAQNVKTKTSILNDLLKVKKEGETNSKPKEFNTAKTYSAKGGLKRAIMNAGFEPDSYELAQNQDGRWVAKLIAEEAAVNKDVVVVSKPMDVSAKASLISQVLFKKGIDQVTATVVACAIVSNEELMNLGKVSELKDAILDDMWDALLYVKNPKPVRECKEDKVLSEHECTEELLKLLVSTDIITENGDMGKFLTRLNEAKPKSYPRIAEVDDNGKLTKPVITKANRRKPIIKGMVAKPSKLTTKAINIMQQQLHTISESMVLLAAEVFSGDYEDLCDTWWVIDGAVHQIELGNLPSVHEWFACSRVRLYQSDSHGSNVQSGDMDRAFSSPFNVSMGYDIKHATLILENEAKDMIKGDLKKCLKLIKTYGEVEFVRESLFGELKGDIKKPWSFVKVARLLSELYKGNRPYLDVTVGLDAKCSGPQLAGLITGFEPMMAACGFSKHVVDDAYEKCCKLLEKRGFVGFDRNLVKGPFMGVFYGQGWRAFANEFMYKEEPSKKQLDKRILTILLGFSEDLEESAKAFHSTIERSFGKAIRDLRTALKEAHMWWDEEGQGHFKTESATVYKMLDGQEIACQYFEKIDIDGDLNELWDAPDVEVTIGINTYKFNKMVFKTDVVDLGRHCRTGFVNFIQANDALLARLIITKLHSLGANTIESVHDCFRVSVPDMIDGKLDDAIKYAYKRMFGSDQDYTCQDLPEGQDGLRMYFEGLNNSLSEEYKLTEDDLNKRFTQFRYKKSKGGKFRNIQPGFINTMMDNLKNENDPNGVTGYSYPFAK